MSDKYPGGIITKTPVVPAGPYQDGAAPGIWTLEQQAYYKAQGLWPIAGNLWGPSNSLRFRQAASANLTRTPGSAGNQQKWTWSGWVKRCDIGSSGCLFGGGTSGSAYAELYFSGDYFAFYNNLNSTANVATNAVYKDPSAWYHLVVAVDTTQATDSNRIKLYVNGVQQTSLSTATYPAQNTNMYVNSAAVHSMGALYYTAGTIDYFDGYLSQVYLIDGQQLTPSSFGTTDATTGVWRPALYNGSYGTNGFYLPFSDVALTSGSNAGLGKDFSGNSNYWNTNNISVTSGVTYDAMIDIPVGMSATIANYAILNQLTTSSTITYAGLRISGAFSAKSTIQIPSTGTWYAEATFTTVATTAYGIDFGLIDSTGNSYALIRAAGSTVQTAGNGGSTTYNSYSTFSSGDVASLTYNVSTGTLNFYKNNVLAATVSGITESGYFIRAGGDGASDVVDVNFGQRPFAYTPPSGYLSLNTYNLPTPTILQGDDYFAATLYTGNGSSQSITNTGFQPDLVWMKNRTSAYSHGLYDSVRGTGTTHSLYSNETVAEGTYSANQNLTSFNSNGFSLGSTSSTNVINTNGESLVAWQWKKTATAGFNIVTWAGNSVNGRAIAHGLGKTPKLIICKIVDGNDLWPVWSAYLQGNDYNLKLDTNDAQATNNAFMQSPAPNATNFYVTSDYKINQTGNNYIAYCFTDIDGFSAFGKYTGNGSNTNGPFVYTGFRPAYTMIKTYDNTGEWTIHDNQRPTYNQSAQYLFADVADSEYNNIYNNIDYLSNGFKLRGTTGTNQNGNGYNYIYMAFAENPFKYALAR